MNRATAICIVGLFGLGGVAVAYWGLTDIRSAQLAMHACTREVHIDNSAFYFLGLCCLPLFAVLAVLPERLHRMVLAATVAIALGVPGATYLTFLQKVDEQDFHFEPPLQLFGLQVFKGEPGPACLPA